MAWRSDLAGVVALEHGLCERVSQEQHRRSRHFRDDRPVRNETCQKPGTLEEAGSRGRSPSVTSGRRLAEGRSWLS
jgi:hypothetical protein